MPSIRRILFATDFSAEADAAWAYATAFARDFEAELDLLHVLGPAPSQRAAGIGSAAATGSAEALRHAEAELHRLVGSAEALGLKAAAHLLPGEPRTQILRFARGQGIGLIVLAAHEDRVGATRASPRLAETIRREASCLVFIAGPPGRTPRAG
ncbi:MAG: universal stress protein [Candidatus Methylomirabilales bacterium]